MLFGVFFDTLGPLKMSRSSRRNTDFHLFGLSETRSKNMSRKSHQKVRFLVDLGLHFERFFLKKVHTNLVQKKNENKKSKKQTFPLFGVGAAVSFGRWERERERV